MQTLSVADEATISRDLPGCKHGPWLGVPLDVSVSKCVLEGGIAPLSQTLTNSPTQLGERTRWRGCCRRREGGPPEWAAGWDVVT